MVCEACWARQKPLSTGAKTGLHKPGEKGSDVQPRTHRTPRNTSLHSNAEREERSPGCTDIQGSHVSHS
jgi:hypothetical protein